MLEPRPRDLNSVFDRSDGNADFETAGQRRAGPGGLVGRDIDNGVSPGGHGPVKGRPPAWPNGAVANQFGVEPAVVREIDFLGHQTIEHWTELRSGPVHLNGKRRLLAQQGRTGERGR